MCLYYCQVCQSLTCAHSSRWVERKLNTSSHPIWVCFLPGRRTALTCSPEGAGTWWFLIWGKWGEIDVRKINPKSPLKSVLTKCFKLTFSPVKSLLCSLPSVVKFWKFLFLPKLLAKLSSIWINCRWVFASLLNVAPDRSSQTLQTVAKFLLSRGLFHVVSWETALVSLLSFPFVFLLPSLVFLHSELLKGGDGNAVRNWHAWILALALAPRGSVRRPLRLSSVPSFSSQSSGDCNTCSAYFTGFP